MALFTRGKRMLNMLSSYLAKAKECMECFMAALSHYLEEGLGEDFDYLVDKVHRAEDSCDDYRREIELMLYEKALLPESRGDILGLLETIDKVPDKAESVCYQIQTESLEMPGEYKGFFRQLVKINYESFLDLLEAVKALQEDLRKVKYATREMVKKEISSDLLEREIIKEIFKSDMPIGDKILLKELAIEIGNISDRAENVGDRLNIIAVKRLL